MRAQIKIHERKEKNQKISTELFMTFGVYPTDNDVAHQRTDQLKSESENTIITCSANAIKPNAMAISVAIDFLPKCRRTWCRFHFFIISLDEQRIYEKTFVRLSRERSLF